MQLTKKGKPTKQKFKNPELKEKALVDMAHGVPYRMLAEKYGVEQSNFSRLKAEQKDRLEKLKLDLAQKVADKLIDNTVSVIDTANQLHKHVKNPDKHSNNTLMQKPEQVLGYLSYAGKIESEIRRSLGFSPSNTPNIIFSNSETQITVQQQVMDSIGKYIDAEIIDCDTE